MSAIVVDGDIVDYQFLSDGYVRRVHTVFLADLMFVDCTEWAYFGQWN